MGNLLVGGIIDRRVQKELTRMGNLLSGLSGTKTVMLNLTRSVNLTVFELGAVGD